MTKYGREMMASTRRPLIGGTWALFVISTITAIILAVIASTQGTSTVASVLWITALAMGTLAIATWYALAIAWARRRKRLWG